LSGCWHDQFDKSAKIAEKSTNAMMEAKVKIKDKSRVIQ